MQCINWDKLTTQLCPLNFVICIEVVLFVLYYENKPCSNIHLNKEIVYILIKHAYHQLICRQEAVNYEAGLGSSAGGAAAGAGAAASPPVFSSWSIIFCFSINIFFKFSKCFSKSSRFISVPSPETSIKLAVMIIYSEHGNIDTPSKKKGEQFMNLSNNDLPFSIKP